MDDPLYVYENAHVRAGLTWQNFKWAWCANVGANWHPLTLLSHMLDCQLLGVNPGRHHFVNVVLHAGNACLLFALLLRMTRKWAASFVVAALFAWHPLHVESVAWISERKDVLSTFFGLGAIYMYACYVEQSKIKNQKSKIYYALALLYFTLSLLAKPMLVTLPFVLLLLDYWPLRRINGEDQTHSIPSWKRSILEKSPFLLLSAISCWVTLWAQKAGEAVVSTVFLPLKLRVAHAALSYWLYLGKIFWPTNLAAFYPYDDKTPLPWTALVPLAALIVVSVTIDFFRKKRYLTVGWFWFCGMLVPVIGLVQVGFQGLADRYTYLPAVGIFMIAAFGGDELAGKVRFVRSATFALIPLVLALCLAGTSRQLSYWRDSVALYTHAFEITKDNYVACKNLGVAFDEKGELKKALVWYKEGVRILPKYSNAHLDLGVAYHKLKQGREAIEEFQAALHYNPSNKRVHFFLGLQFLEMGDARHAVEQLRIALAQEPQRAGIHYQLGVALSSLGEIQEAQQCWREAFRLKPDWAEALNNLAWSLATDPDAQYRNGGQAIDLALRGVELTHTNNPAMLDTLSAAYAEAGRFSEGIQAAQTAAQLARDFHSEPLLREIEKHLQSYREQKPVRENPVKSTESSPPDKVTP